MMQSTARVHDFTEVSRNSILSMDMSLASVFAGRPLERLSAGNPLFWEGDPAQHVFEVVEGVVRVFKILADGRRSITGFLYSGDLVGVSLGDLYLYSVEAVGAVKVRRFSRSNFQDAIARSPELRPQLFAKLCDEIAQAQEQIVLLSRKNAEERICSFLILMRDRVTPVRGDGGTIELPMTRLDVADYLGLTIETVSRTMTNLASRGIICQTGRHQIDILKADVLERLAGDGNWRENAAPGSECTRQAIWPN